MAGTGSVVRTLSDEALLTGLTRDGRHLSLGATVLGGTHLTWGAQIPVNLTQVSQLQFEAASGQSTIIAYLNPRNPWSPG
jgi:hypothetical protein